MRILQSFELSASTVIAFRLKQEENAPLPMVATLLGIVMLVRS